MPAKSPKTDPLPAEGKAARKEWLLRLYVAGMNPASMAAFENLKRICEDYLAGQYQIEVVDILEHPQLAKGEQIIALPTLVRRLPPPVKQIIGDLSDRHHVLIGLDLRPAD